MTDETIADDKKEEYSDLSDLKTVVLMYVYISMLVLIVFSIGYIYRNSQGKPYLFRIKL